MLNNLHQPQSHKHNVVRCGFFDWKFLNVWMANNIVERHYKCQNTGAYRCKEYKLGKSYKTVTYCLPNSEDYNIESEEKLFELLLK